MVPRLPDDLWALVQEHLARGTAATRVQRAFRARAFRHTQRPEWRRLRRRLCAVVGSEGVDVLQQCGGVRREWMEEPTSWLENEATDVLAVLAEVVDAHGPWHVTHWPTSLGWVRHTERRCQEHSVVE